MATQGTKTQGTKKRTKAATRRPAAKERAAPKSKGPTARAAHRDVAVKVDARIKRAWQEARRRLQSALERGASAFDELWETAAEVVDQHLYLVEGYATAAEFFEGMLHESERTARRMIRVARHATPAEEERYGVSVLDAALGFIEAKIGHPVDGPLPVAFDRLKIPVERNGQTAEVPLAQATVAEINHATARLVGRKGPPASPIERTVKKALAGTKELKGVAIRERGGTLTFAHVPADQLARFGRTLAGVKLP